MHVSKMLQEWLGKVLPEIHSRRRSALGSVVSAAIDGGRLTVTALGRSIRSSAKEKHNIKRADRFLSNEKLQGERNEVYRAIAQEVIGETQNPVVLVDWSDIDKGQKFFLLRASTPAKGRSLTLYEEVHGVSTKEKPQTHRQFLKALKNILPSGCRPIIVTDAGFKTPWFSAVRRMKWDFVGRVRGKSKVKFTKESPWKAAKSLYAEATEKPIPHMDVYLTERNKFNCNLVLYKAKPKGRIKKTQFGKRARSIKNVRNAAREREPWILATSLQGETLANVAVSIYASRMQIEEAFRDLKSSRCGLSLEFTGTYSINRLSVLVLVGSLATAFAWLLGKATEIAGTHRTFQANSIKHKTILSSVFLGFQVFRSSAETASVRLLYQAKIALHLLVKQYAYQT